MKSENCNIFEAKQLIVEKKDSKYGTKGKSKKEKRKNMKQKKITQKKHEKQKRQLLDR